jgi:hypothetical protein
MLVLNVVWNLLEDLDKRKDLPYVLIDVHKVEDNGY